MKRSITCLNDEGIFIKFTNQFNQFLLVDCDGIYSVENDVYTSESTNSDGAFFVGSKVKMRNIVLTVKEKGNHEENRDLLYRVFKLRSKGTFIYAEDDSKEIKKKINYIVESVKVSGETSVRMGVISLLCADPYFTDLYDIHIAMAGWDKRFTFPHNFLQTKESFANFEVQKLKDFDNDSIADNMGVTVHFKAEGTVRNPSITHIQTNSMVKVGKSNNPFILNFGDELIISTNKGDKNAYLIRNGIKTLVNRYLDEDSYFFQLVYGKNQFRYFAESGEDNLLVSIIFQKKYLGV